MEYFIMIYIVYGFALSSRFVSFLNPVVTSTLLPLILIVLMSCSRNSESRKDSSKQQASSPVIPEQIYVYRGWGDSDSKQFLACFEEKKDLLTQDQLSQLLLQSVSFGGEGYAVSYASKSIFLGDPENIDRSTPSQQCLKTLVFLSGDQNAIKNALLSNQWAYERARNEFLEKRRPYLEARMAMIERIKKLDEEMLEAR